MRIHVGKKAQKKAPLNFRGAIILRVLFLSSNGGQRGVSGPASVCVCVCVCVRYSSELAQISAVQHANRTVKNLMKRQSHCQSFVRLCPILSPHLRQIIGHFLLLGLSGLSNR